VRWSNTSAEKTEGASAGASTSAFISVLKESQLRGDAMGVAEGPVRIIRDSSEFGKLLSRAVLVAPCTNPAWTEHFLRAAAVVVDSGGAASLGPGPGGYSVTILC
jgi:phosphoenolpyruvate synthase/pyruvate phosphate dikinase